VIANCQPNEEALAALKGRLQKARADSKLNKGTIMKGVINYAMYGAKNPFNDQLTQAELDGITAAELTNILHELPTYKHTVIYWGPQPLATAVADIKQLHPLPASFKAIPAAEKFVKVDQQKNQVLFADYDMVQTEVNWLRNSTVYDPAKTGIVSLFNNYFGGGMGSVVFQTIRESKALAYSTYAFYAPPAKKDERYSIVAYVGSQADKMDDAIHGMNELLNDIPRSDKLLETARKSLKQDIETERIINDDIIFSYLAAQKLGLKTDIRKEVYASIDKMNFDEVKQFHDQYVANKPYTYCIVASAKKISEDDLKKYGEVKKLSLEEIFGY
jgi:predicted Zn-dependent peptidase